MYDIDRQKVDEYLNAIDQVLSVTDQLQPNQSQIHQYAAERCLHICIEAVADIGNLLIDGFIMRDPGSYEDIIEILRDEKVISEEVADQLVELVKFRKSLVQFYTDVDQERVFTLIKNSEEALRLFSPQVKGFIERESF